MAKTEGRILKKEVTNDMSDDDSSKESSNRRELKEAEVADTPNEDPRGQTAEATQSESAENDTEE